jgi:glyoxylase-like metal-dependent hydrolase (beta-lactamase superfamily II)
VRFEQVHDRVYRVPSVFGGSNVTNVYIVRGAQTAVIDTGVLGTPTRDVTPALASLGLTLGDVDLVINTHGHTDHLGGNAELKDAGAEILLHRDDLWRATSNQRVAQDMLELHRILDLEEVGRAQEAMTLKLLGREVDIDRVLEDGDVVDLGADVRLHVVHTPGHTEGSVCFWWESESILFTGDAVQGRGGAKGGLPILQYPLDYVRSIQRVRDVGASTLLMGHAFLGHTDALGPVARGARAAELLRESIAVHDALARSFKAARASTPGAHAAEIARSAIAEVRDELDLEDEADSGFPRGVSRTVPAYLKLTT